MLNTFQKQTQAMKIVFRFLHNIPERKPKKPPCGYIYDFSLEEKLNVVRKGKICTKKKIGKYQKKIIFR